MPRHTNGYFKVSRRISSSSLWAEHSDIVRLMYLLIELSQDPDGPYDGRIFTSRAVLADKAHMTPARLDECLAVLQSPDPESRTAKADGIRVETIRGGFRLVNFGSYHDRATREEIRAKRAAAGRRGGRASAAARRAKSISNAGAELRSKLKQTENDEQVIRENAEELARVVPETDVAELNKSNPDARLRNESAEANVKQTRSKTKQRKNVTWLRRGATDGNMARRPGNASADAKLAVGSKQAKPKQTPTKTKQTETETETETYISTIPENSNSCGHATPVALTGTFWDSEPAAPSRRKRRGGGKATLAPDDPSFRWSGEACDDWIARFGGEAPGGEIGKAMKPLIVKHGWPAVRPAWRRFLAEADALHVTVARFVKTYGRWAGTHNDPRPGSSKTERSLAAIANARADRRHDGNGTGGHRP